jgi:hypothetical protein
MVESSIAKRATKWPWKQEIKVENKF